MKKIFNKLKRADSPERDPQQAGLVSRAWRGTRRCEDRSDARWKHRTEGSLGAVGERGSILIYAVLMLGSILAITLSLAAIFIPKIRASSNAGAGSVGAIYAADSALEWCIYTNRGNPALAQPVMANGAVYTFSGDCAPSDQAVDVRAIGTYRGVSRSLEVTITAAP